MDRKRQLNIMKDFHIIEGNVTYEDAVESLLLEYLTIRKQIMQDNKERFRQELNRVLKPNN